MASLAPDLCEREHFLVYVSIVVMTPPAIIDRIKEHPRPTNRQSKSKNFQAILASIFGLDQKRRDQRREIIAKIKKIYILPVKG